MTTPELSQALDEQTVLSLLSSPKKEEPQNTITFWYGGWSLNELRKMKPDLFYDQSWYDKEKFADEKHEMGMYTVCLKVPNSNMKTFAEQKELLGKDEVCPITIAATAYLLSFLQTGSDPLDGNYTRCKEQDASGYRVGLYFGEGRLYVDSYWVDGRYDLVWVSSYQSAT